MTEIIDLIAEAKLHLQLCLWTTQAKTPEREAAFQRFVRAVAALNMWLNENDGISSLPNALAVEARACQLAVDRIRETLT